MTQGALAEAIYGDKSHGPNMYAALTGLVTGGVVIRRGSNSSYYSLYGLGIVFHEKQIQKWQDSFNYKAYKC